MWVLMDFSQSLLLVPVDSVVEEGRERSFVELQECDSEVNPLSIVDLG